MRPGNDEPTGPDSRARRSGWTRRVAALAPLIALGLVGLALVRGGHGPGRALSTVLFTSFGTVNAFVDTLEKLVPVLLLGYAFALPLAAGRSNIGGEGQMVVGAMGAVAAGIALRGLPPTVHVPLVLVAGVATGATWGALAGWLLFRFGVNEVLSTVLMNFISLGLANYVATEVWPDPLAGHPTTIPIAISAHLPLLWRRPPVSWGLVVALGATLATAVWVRCTAVGYELVATGANPRAARVHGIDDARMTLVALAAGGALAGLAGAIDVAGVHHRLIEGLQSNYLVLGILSGLIARGSFTALVPIAFAVSVLEVGASALQRRMLIPSETVLLVEAAILLGVLAWDRRRGP